MYMDMKYLVIRINFPSFLVMYDDERFYASARKDRCAFSYDFEFHNKKRAFRAYVNNIHPDQTAMQNMP